MPLGRSWPMIGQDRQGVPHFVSRKRGTARAAAA